MSKCQKCCTAITVLFTAAGLITVLIIGTLVYPLEIRNALLKLTANSNTISNSTNVINENDTIFENDNDDGDDSVIEHTTWYVPADPENSHEHVKIHKGKNANSNKLLMLDERSYNKTLEISKYNYKNPLYISFWQIVNQRMVDKLG